VTAERYVALKVLAENDPYLQEALIGYERVLQDLVNATMLLGTEMEMRRKAERDLREALDILQKGST
jgi:hypothetical protein